MASPAGDRPSLAYRLVLRLISLYPPYVGAGIRARFLPDGYTVETRMRLGLTNRNALGTHFGGSLYSMCDPFFVLLLIRHLGRRFVVWDKSATIEFRKPGRGTVRARFHIPPEEVERLRTEAEAGAKLEPVYETHVVDEAGEVVAVVTKRLYVRKAKAT